MVRKEHGVDSGFVMATVDLNYDYNIEVGKRYVSGGIPEIKVRATHNRATPGLGGLGFGFGFGFRWVGIKSKRRALRHRA